MLKAYGALIRHLLWFRKIVVQGSLCGECASCGGSALLRKAEDVFQKVLDSVGFARVSTFQQERIAGPLQSIRS
jgi:hypothetical protein